MEFLLDYNRKIGAPSKSVIMNKKINDIDFVKSGGLVPVIVQNVHSREVLTLAYANKESLELTQKTGNSWFWSRSRNKLWMKGEESGNIQKVKEILVDCDSDAIIYLVEPSGPACHTGEKVCFHNVLEK
jgi:phosphoribosyl-AMP cyclohydrolase